MPFSLPLTSEQSNTDGEVLTDMGGSDRQDTVDVDGRTRESVNLLRHERQGVYGCVELCLGNR